MSTYGRIAQYVIVVVAVAALFASFGVPARPTLAQNVPGALPVTGAARPNYTAGAAEEYVTQLDDLRAKGIAAHLRAATGLANPGVYEFSSDLERLNAGARASVRSAANDYIDTLDHLRSMQYRQGR